MTSFKPKKRFNSLKSIALCILLAMFCLPLESHATDAVAEGTKMETHGLLGKGKRNKNGKRKKNGRYKKRRGLFGKRSSCGCPKH